MVGPRPAPVPATERVGYHWITGKETIRAQSERERGRGCSPPRTKLCTNPVNRDGASAFCELCGLVLYRLTPIAIACGLKFEYPYLLSLHLSCCNDPTKRFPQPFASFL